MATPAELMQTLSDATGLPMATIVDLDRKLVQAGLRGKAGRGFNAAEMTPLDAARLVTSILAAPRGVAAAGTIARYAGALVDQGSSSPSLYADTGLAELSALPSNHSFVDALTAIIGSASEGALAALVKGRREVGGVRLEVVALTHSTRGRIRFSSLPNRRVAVVEYASPAKAARRTNAAVQLGDFEQSRRITELTILPVARLLMKERESE